MSSSLMNVSITTPSLCHSSSESYSVLYSVNKSGKRFILFYNDLMFLNFISRIFQYRPEISAQIHTADCSLILLVNKLLSCNQRKNQHLRNKISRLFYLLHKIFMQTMFLFKYLQPVCCSGFM